MLRVIVLFVVAATLLSPVAAFSRESEIARGMKYFSQGKYQDAIKSFFVAKPADFTKDSYVAWGLSAYKLGKYESAALKFKNASELDPKDGDVYAITGECYYKIRKFHEAVQSFQKTVGLKVKDRGSVYFLWAESDVGLGKFGEAIANYKKALPLKKENEFDIRLGWGVAATELKKYSEAEQQLTLALKKNPDNPKALGALGTVWIKTARSADAVKTLEKAVKIDPKSVLNQYNLACAYAMENKASLACGALSVAFDAGFNQPETAEKDEDLKNIRDEECFRRIIEKAKAK